LSLTRQVVVVLIVALLLSAAAGLGVQAWSTRDALQSQLEARNADAAALMAPALSLQGGDPMRLAAAADAALESGHYRRLAVRAADGRTRFERRGPGRGAAAPAWLASALPIDAAPGVAPVMLDDGEVGRLEVEADPATAREALWLALQRGAALLAALILVAAAAALLLLRACMHPLNAIVAQARALEEGRFAVTDEPRPAELQQLARGMNSMVERLDKVFAVQATQVDALQRQAHHDAVTGLSNRRRFLSLLESAPAGALLILRLQDLEGVNRRLGHEATDHVLAAVAEVLQTYPQRVAGAVAGRLNGSDFALALPVSGVAAETAASLLQALRASPAGTVGELAIVVGGIDGLQGAGAAAQLAAADAALAQAEAAGAFAIEVQSATRAVAVQAGSRAWRRQIAQALAEGRAALAEFAVLDGSGRQIYLECPLRVQFEPGGEFLAAGRWLALAARSRLLPQVDLRAIELALQAIAGDGVARCVHVAAASLATADFVDEVRQRLLRQPGLASRLVLEVAERAIEPFAAQLQQAALAWREAGARVGLEHAGGALEGRTWLRTLGLEHVKLAAGFVRGVAVDVAVRDYASGLVALVHGLGLRVVAEGIDDAGDLAVLWALGFDGATGPAVRAAPT
jgi:diguanylate cyclase (GGDEF)-like protein